MINGKKVVVGISGGIAAYKVPMLVRLLIKKDCEVRVVATDNALKFVSEVTLQTLSSYPVYNDMFSRFQEKTTNHISLAQWGEIFIVAPATANIIGKYANAIADDALSTTLLAFNKKVFLCPAMNNNMYENIGVQENIDKLKKRGVEIIDSEQGDLACGTVGKGRMAEVEHIVKYIEDFFEENKEINKKNKDFSGQVITITAGATRENIDKVRFISNASSGKMGYELAKELLRRGAKVNLVCGVVSQTIEENDCLNLVKVVSAQEMFDATVGLYSKSDACICSAAVADYTPEVTYPNKLKKQEAELTIKLKPTKDILAYLGKNKKKQILVGFALETDNEIENAKKKLKDKNLDFIVLNSLNDKGAGFDCNTNKVTLIDKNNMIALPLKTKEEVAKDIIDKLLTLMK